MQDNNKTLIKTVKTPLKLSETHSKTWTRPCLQENLQMSILQQEDNMYAYIYDWHQGSTDQNRLVTDRAVPS